MLFGGEGLLYNKPVQALRLTKYITRFMLNQLKIDRSPILMVTSDYLPVIQIIKKEPETAVSLSSELISVVHLVHQLDDCLHLTCLWFPFEDLNDWEVITGCHQNRNSVSRMIETLVYFQLVRHKSSDIICMLFL